MSITVSTISTNLLFLCRLYFPELYFRKSEQAHLLGFPFLQDYSPHQKTIQLETEQKTRINIFPQKKTLQMLNRHMKRYTPPLTIREMQIKTTVSYHPIPVRRAIIKKTRNNKYYQR